MPDFEVLVNDTFLNLISPMTVLQADRKRLFAMANDFEDGKWRQIRFNDYVWNNIAQTALSARERELLANKPASMLRKAAKNLRLTDADSDPGAGSELAEIVLYGVMRDYFDALPVVPKIFYKQNVNDYAKGADSVHIVLVGDEFTLWLGEAKFYKDIEDARLAKIVASLTELLSTDKLKKENTIITNVSDINFLSIDDAMKKKIMSVLNSEMSIDTLKPILNVPILLLYECSLTKVATELSESYRDAMRDHQISRAKAYFAKQIAALADTVHMYSLIRFHLIFFPVPDKKICVDTFLSTADKSGA